METTNAWDPVEESVAQQTAESSAEGVYRDDVEPPARYSIRNKRERWKALQIVYGDSWWVTDRLDRIDAEIEELLPRDPAQAERFFLNRKRAEEGAAFDHAKWADLEHRHEVPEGALITVGVDGARSDDALAVIGTEVETGYQFVIGIWEHPPNDEDYEHPTHEVDGAVSEAFERYSVWRLYADPQYIDALIVQWQGRYGDKRVMKWYTHRPRQMAFAVRNYAQAIASGELKHDGDAVMARHIGNARKQRVNVYDDERRRMWTVSKDAPMSPRKIDAAAAGILSWEARSDAIASGATVPAEPGILIGLS